MRKESEDNGYQQYNAYFAIVTFIVYALVCVVLGNVASRKKGQRGWLWQSYFAGGGNMGFLAAGFMIATSSASGGTFLSNPAWLMPGG